MGRSPKEQLRCERPRRPAATGLRYRPGDGRKHGFSRKLLSKGEARKIVGHGQFFVVAKEELAQAVAGCDLDPVIIRSGREKLFTEEWYRRIFPYSDPDYYLPRYRLMREVTRGASGQPERGYAKWLVLNFTWSHVKPRTSGRQKSRAFRVLCEKQEKGLVVPLGRAINEVFVEVLKYYRATRGEGGYVLDVSQFFRNRKGHHARFAKWWEEVVSSTRRQAFEGDSSKVQNALASFKS